MSDSISTTAAHLQALLLEGKLTHRFKLAGEEVVLDLFPAGVWENILVQAIGPDEYTREYRRNVLSLAHALRSIGGYDFEGKFDKRLEFVRGLQRPVQALLIEEMIGAQIRQHEETVKRLEELKKSSPGQS